MSVTVQPIKARLLTAIVAVVVCTHVAGADWLAGPPDTAHRPGYQAYYDWILSAALEQTGYNLRRTPASENTRESHAVRLAYDRLINAANKLADHMIATGSEQELVEIRYLIVGAAEPRHFKLAVPRSRLIELGVIEDAQSSE
jgi:hypothetical protein